MCICSLLKVFETLEDKLNIMGRTGLIKIILGTREKNGLDDFTYSLLLLVSNTPQHEQMQTAALPVPYSSL